MENISFSQGFLQGSIRNERKKCSAFIDGNAIFAS
jgi:hypothetical protein